MLKKLFATFILCAGLCFPFFAEDMTEYYLENPTEFFPLAGTCSFNLGGSSSGFVSSVSGGARFSFTALPYVYGAADINFFADYFHSFAENESFAELGGFLDLYLLTLGMTAQYSREDLQWNSIINFGLRFGFIPVPHSGIEFTLLGNVPVSGGDPSVTFGITLLLTTHRQGYLNLIQNF